MAELVSRQVILAFMSRYQFFQHVSAIGWIASGLVGIIAFVLRSRTGAWYSLSVRIFTVSFFFLLPVAMFSSLLSEPLHEQSLYRVCLWFSLICLYLLLGAIAIGRSSWRRSSIQTRPSIPQGADKPLT
jgi:hypothetical protein